MSQSNLLKLYSVNNEALAEVHDIITPAEIRQGERVTAKVKWKQGKFIKAEELRVWRLSPLGVEVTNTPTLENITVGEPIELEITVGKQLSTVNAVKVTNSYIENEVELIGFRICTPNDDSWKGVERRANKRWNCSVEFMPTGVCPNPGRFNDFIFFRIADISGKGFRFLTSLRNSFLIPGMVLDTTVSFPLVGQTQIKVIIRNTSIQSENGKSVLGVGVEFVEPKKIAKEILGQYVFQFGPTTTLSEIREEELDVIKPRHTIDFRFVRTNEEYTEVLELRRLAYADAGKIDENSDLQSVSDIFDSRSRIVIGLHRGKIVCSARLIFNELDDQMEHEQFITFPEEFPRKDEICEITRVCVDPGYRGSQILLDLFNFIGLTVVQSKRKYILGCGTDEILPLYKNIGFKITNISYEHSSLNNVKHTVFLGDVIKGLTGIGVSPVYWNIVWGNLYEYLQDLSYVSPDPFTSLRVGFYRLFRPLSFFLYRWKKTKKSNGKKQ